MTKVSTTARTPTATEIPMSSTMSFLEEKMKEVPNMMLLPSSSSTMLDHSVEDSTMTTPTAICGWTSDAMKTKVIIKMTTSRIMRIMIQTLTILRMPRIQMTKKKPMFVNWQHPLHLL
jgi:ABC-type proline/glycine betaine transport system substrate-binding protein